MHTSFMNCLYQKMQLITFVMQSVHVNQVFVILFLF